MAGDIVERYEADHLAAVGIALLPVAADAEDPFGLFVHDNNIGCQAEPRVVFFGTEAIVLKVFVDVNVAESDSVVVLGADLLAGKFRVNIRLTIECWRLRIHHRNVQVLAGGYSPIELVATDPAAFCEAWGGIQRVEPERHDEVFGFD